MVYELRGYDIDPDRWDEYLAWAENRAFPVLFETFQFRLVGIWQAVAKEGEASPATNLQYILAWESEAEMRERWAAVFASDAWQAAWAEAVDPATGERKYHRQVRSVLMRALPRSPLR
jgi:NIPSNAP protein